MSSVSFEVKQDALALVKNTVIEANFEECAAALKEMIEPYKTLIVSEDGIAAAKSDRAKIRKVSSSIDEMRKTVKKAYQEPLKAFEDKCKALVAIVDDGAANLDSQIKAFEDAEKAEKLEKLHSEYIAMTNDETELYCPWECVFNDKWGNKTFTYDAAVDEIKSALEQTINDLAAIRDMGGNDTPYLLDVYKQTHELSAVVRKASELKTMRANEEARKRMEADAFNNLPSNATEAQPQEYLPQTINAADIPNETVTVSFKVVCTKQQLAALGAYMKLNGIIYGRIGE